MRTPTAKVHLIKRFAKQVSDPFDLIVVIYFVIVGNVVVFVFFASTVAISVPRKGSYERSD